MMRAEQPFIESSISAACEASAGCGAVRWGRGHGSLNTDKKRLMTINLSQILINSGASSSRG